MRAWEILTAGMKRPEFPPKPPTLPREFLAHEWEINPANVVNARAFAHLLETRGDRVQSREIIHKVAQRSMAPAWFVRAAAFSLAEEKRLSEAVELLLKDALR